MASEFRHELLIVTSDDAEILPGYHLVEEKTYIEWYDPGKDLRDAVQSAVQAHLALTPGESVALILGRVPNKTAKAHWQEVATACSAGLRIV